MTTTITPTNGNSTWQSTWSAATAKINNIALYAARYYYIKEFGNDTGFDSLTNAQKLAYVDEAMKQTIINAAKKQYFKSNTEPTNETVQAEADQLDMT